jgi:hypothetical protein
MNTQFVKEWFKTKCSLTLEEASNTVVAKAVNKTGSS